MYCFMHKPAKNKKPNQNISGLYTSSFFLGNFAGPTLAGVLVLNFPNELLRRT